MFMWWNESKKKIVVLFLNSFTAAHFKVYILDLQVEILQVEMHIHLLHIDIGKFDIFAPNESSICNVYRPLATTQF